MSADLIDRPRLRASLEHLADRTRDDAASARMRPWVVATLERDVTAVSRFEQYGTEFEFRSDESVERGGHDSAPSPMRYLLSSIAFCMLGWCAKTWAARDVAVRSLETAVRNVPRPARRAPRGRSAAAPAVVRREVRIDDDADPETAIALVREAARRCPTTSLMAQGRARAPGAPAARLDPARHPTRRAAHRAPRGADPMSHEPAGATGGPLRGIRVIELGQYISGPYAAKLLADLGAEVIKVESPDGDPMRRWEGHGTMSPQFAAYNRGKRAVALDLKRAGRPRGAARPRARCRRAHRELPARRRGPSRLRPGRPARAQPAPRLVLDHRLRPRGSVRGPPRLRHRHLGGRRDVQPGRARRHAAAARPGVLRPALGHVGGAGGARGAARARRRRRGRAHRRVDGGLARRLPHRGGLDLPRDRAGRRDPTRGRAERRPTRAEARTAGPS